MRVFCIMCWSMDWRGLKRKFERDASFANAAASLITTRKGALRVMPEKEEIEKCYKKWEGSALPFLTKKMVLSYMYESCFWYRN